MLPATVVSLRNSISFSIWSPELESGLPSTNTYSCTIRSGTPDIDLAKVDIELHNHRVHDTSNSWYLEENDYINLHNIPGRMAFKLSSCKDMHVCREGEGRSWPVSKMPNLQKKNIDGDFNINFSLHAITSHFEVYGTNDGCQWKGNFGYSEEHSNRWAKLKLECENNGRNQFLRQEEMVSHLL